MSHLVFAREFFDLQLAFAERVRALSGMTLERALLEYTNLYVRFGLGRVFDADDARWQAYLDGLRRAQDGGDWTYRFYLRDPEATTAPDLVATFGCFSYALPDQDHVRLHFRNAEAGGHSPLAAARTRHRRAELRALFEHVRRTAPEDVPVVGVSWLYNLEAYRRLFPVAYTATARAVRGGFRSMPLWGQFLDHRGRVKESMARPFLASLARQEDLALLEKCFPFQVLTVEAPARRFHDDHGI